MKVHLPYGKNGLDVDLPDHADVFLPPSVDPLADPEAAIHRALVEPIGSPPLRDLIRPFDSVAIVISDITRPVPNRLLVPPLLDTIGEAGVARENVVIIVGTGLHRASTPEERSMMLGEEIARTYRIIDHDARDESTLEYAGKTARGADIRVNRDYLNADIKILTGFIEPHIFCGYSGGGKAVLPGVSGAKTIIQHHSYAMLAHPRSSWCQAQGSPTFDESREAALLTKPDLLLNVTLDEKKQVTGVFAGEMVAAHDAGIAQVARQSLTPIDRLYDIVVTTNMGWAADINLYQGMKGMSIGSEAVKPGGAVVLAAECAEALGNDEFVELLFSDSSIQRIMERLANGYQVDDQWGVQCIGRIVEKAQVWLHSSMSREMTERAHLRYSDDVGETVASLAAEFESKNGGEPSIAVFPYGQLTVPRLR